MILIEILTQNDTAGTLAKWAGIISLIFAVFTYWYDRFSKLNNKKGLKKHINTELRTLYFKGIIHEILEYDKWINNGKTIVTTHAVLDCPTIEYVVNTNKASEIFKHYTSSLILQQIVSELKHFQKYIDDYRSTQHHTAENSEQFHNFIFKNRILPIREYVLELSLNESFIDLSILPKKLVGFLPGKKDPLLKKVKKSFRNNREFEEFKIQSELRDSQNIVDRCVEIQQRNNKTYEIIDKYLPGKSYRIIPKQYFGDDE